MLDHSSFEPLYHQIKRDIEEQILDGRIKIGDKLMSENEMLSYYNVGRMTVRNALAELVASGCLRKEQGKGTFCAAMPKQQGRRNVHVLLNTADRYFTPYFLSGISRVLDGAKCNLLLQDTWDSMDHIATLLEQAVEQGTCGIILQPYTGADHVLEGCANAISRCKELGVPLITLDGKFKDIDTAYIINHDERGGEMATQHLIDMGHTNILGLFRGRYRDAKFRANGYRTAMEKAGLPVHILDADITKEDEWISYIHREKITGIVCYNDYLAVKCYHCFDRNNIRVGEDISVIGFDDTELSRTSLPRITTVTHPKDAMGQRAAQYILDCINGNGEKTFHYVYEPDLICRDSTRRNMGAK